MKKVNLITSLAAAGLLAACSGQADQAEAPKAEEAAPAAAADADNDTLAPAAAKEGDHAHGDGEGEHAPH
jgi:hypothetical protein